jgi:serine/threonine-protein kinase
MEHSRTAKPPASTVSAHIEKIVASASFRGSPRLSTLLQYTTSRTLAGQSADLKECLIGVGVFGRTPGYDSHTCSVVRVEFSRLRKKLDHYYQSEGRQDVMRIALKRGTYVPEFHWVDQADTRQRPNSQMNHVAVLPFTCERPSDDDRYFASGLTEELITALGRFRGLRVVARTSSFALEHENSDIRAIGRALSVSCVLKGSVWRHGDRLRIYAQLVHSDDATQIWAEKYEPRAADVFDVQDQIAHAIVSALELELPLVPGRAAAPRARSARAHELYLKGRYWWHRSNPAACARAAELFREAIECDPLYPAPYSGLADALFNQGMYGYAAPSSLKPHAEAAARRALELDDYSAEAHCSLGLIEGGFNWNSERCEKELRRSVELNGSYALGLAKYGTSYLSPLERFDEARAYILRGLELDPLSSNLHADLTLNLLYTGECDHFEREARKILAMETGIFKLQANLVACLGFRGAWSAAIEAAEQACAQFAEHPYILAYTAWAYSGSGQTERATAIRAKLEERGGVEYVPPSAAALTYLHYDIDMVFRHLEKAVEAGEPVLRYTLGQSPLRYHLHSDPRFVSLKRRVGL